MSTIKSSDEHLTLNADGASKDIKFQANGVEKASISSAGAFTSTTIDATALTGNLPAISAASLTNIPAANITGTLPAIDGSNLTGVGVAGISSSADATAMTIDSNEHVGIGISPKIISGGSKYLTVGTQTANSAGFLELVGNRTANAGQDTAIMKFINNTTEIAEIGAYDNGSTNGGDLKFKTSSGGTASTQLEITSDGRGLSQFTAKAWIHISNNATINDSHNISSLTDMTTGRMKIFFTNNPASANYSISAITSKNGGGASSSNFGKVCIPEDKYSSNFQLFTQLGTSNTDTVLTSAVIFGD
jgi:hypothetical protein